MGLQGIDAKARNCYFYDEFTLEMHDNYTQTNCKLECAIKYAQNMTGFKCTPWYLPTQDHPGLGFPARHIIIPTLKVQVNLCQKHIFLHQLTHNMTKDCSLNYKFSA